MATLLRGQLEISLDDPKCMPVLAGIHIHALDAADSNSFNHHGEYFILYDFAKPTYTCVELSQALDRTLAIHAPLGFATSGPTMRGPDARPKHYASRRISHEDKGLA